MPMHRRSFLAALAAAAVARPAWARYAPTLLAARVVKADRIVHGFVVGVGRGRYRFAAQSTWVGAHAEVFSVRRFQDWTCAQRGEDYVDGQEMVLFLSSDEHGPYSIGAGCEGEARVIGGSVVVRHGPGETDTWTTPHGSTWGSRWDFDEVADSVRFVREHLREGASGVVVRHGREGAVEAALKGSGLLAAALAQVRV